MIFFLHHLQPPHHIQVENTMEEVETNLHEQAINVEEFRKFYHEVHPRGIGQKSRNHNDTDASEAWLQVDQQQGTRFMEIDIMPQNDNKHNMVLCTTTQAERCKEREAQYAQWPEHRMEEQELDHQPISQPPLLKEAKSPNMVNSPTSTWSTTIPHSPQPSYITNHAPQPYQNSPHTPTTPSLQTLLPTKSHLPPFPFDNRTLLTFEPASPTPQGKLTTLPPRS